jgi:hypothetical protein
MLDSLSGQLHIPVAWLRGDSPHFSLNKRRCGTQTRSWCFGVKKNILPLSGMEPPTPQSLVQPGHRRINILNAILAPYIFKLLLKWRDVWMIKWKCFEKLLTFRMSVTSTHLVQCQTVINLPAIPFRCCYMRVMKPTCCTVYLQFIQSLYLYMFRAC